MVRSSGVLGSIGLDQTGELRWRQILPNNETIFTLTSYTDNEVLTLSSAEGTATSMIRLWTSKDGALTWETEMETPIDGQGESDIITVAGDGKKKNIIAMRGKTGLLYTQTARRTTQHTLRRDICYRCRS